MTILQPIDPIVIRRILLAKEFFNHGLEQSKQAGALSKMMAVHNFHIAIEIVIKAIMLHHHIRTEKTLNIDFESMLSEIDSHPLFKTSGQKLPYRQELRTLNQLRNLVQHQAIEPETSSMEEWRVFSRRFLERSLKEYFGVEFASLSRMEFIEDARLRKILTRACDSLQSGDTIMSCCFSAIAFEYASSSVSDCLPSEGLNSTFFINAGLSHSGMEFRGLIDGFEKTFKRIRESEHFSAMIATGITLVDYKKFERLTPSVMLSISGHPHCSLGRERPAPETAEWVHSFVVNSIVSWQTQGLDPRVPEWCQRASQEVADGAWPRGDNNPSNRQVDATKTEDGKEAI